MKSRAESQKTRQLILRTAFEEIHKNGFRATGLNEILARTGLTKGAFYHHFPNKAALGRAIVEELLEPLVRDIWLNPLEGLDDPLEGLKRMLRETKTDPASIGLGCPLNNLAVEMAPVDDEIRRRVNKAYDVWIDGYAQALERGKEKGRVARDVDSRAAALFLVATMAGCRALAKSAQDPGILLACQETLADY
ncbi:MAG: TetR/AcrR family transcriptional regulator, partial [Thermodesulfobacteriota bacterium]